MRIFSRRSRASVAAVAAATPSSKGSSKGYSLLDSQLVLSGDLETNGSLRIDGKMEGSVLRADMVVLGVGATMAGDIHAREVVIGGTLTGSVHGSERVELQATAVVTGDVHTGSVLIQEGGVVNGRVLMGPSAPTIMGRPTAHEPAEPARR
jgi:cytoskeletal protein CcmA (bactofilin family)